MGSVKEAALEKTKEAATSPKPVAKRQRCLQNKPMQKAQEAAEEAEEGDEGCGRGTSCALAVQADNALRTTTRRRQTRAATPVGRPGATAGGSECEAPDPMGALAGDTCPAQGMDCLLYTSPSPRDA